MGRHWPASRIVCQLWYGLLNVPHSDGVVSVFILLAHVFCCQQPMKMSRNVHAHTHTHTHKHKTNTNTTSNIPYPPPHLTHRHTHTHTDTHRQSDKENPAYAKRTKLLPVFLGVSSAVHASVYCRLQAVAARCSIAVRRRFPPEKKLHIIPVCMHPL